LKEKYFSSDEITLIHEDLPLIFNNIRKNNIKIALNTGYNKDIQHLIIKKLSMNEFIDDYISSEEVPKGRPYPFMINTLMERNGIENPNEVIKFGDTKVDVLEGINANCLASVGVLSGADKENMLTNSTIVIEDVTKIKL
jgi:phosphoglycolate phosphatase-like HAD superfamily hydrolase